MRYLAILILSVAISPSFSLAKSGDTPTSAPDAKARIGPAIADLFNQTHIQRQLTRQQLENEPDLPALLAALLADVDPAIRRTSLMLLRDHYGDWPVVSAVQTMLRSELARGDKGDAYVVSACCDILADWPQWDSIPVLLN
ncbi:MAG: hypothetical protein PHU85_14990, partial [Phycisphaerae bacterium]|nr:hypothetical protein [Phycisphaerae bacterium]